jgi:hypothetical protein
MQLLELPEALLELIVSKLRAANKATIQKLASTSHKLLQTVLESCSCLHTFDLTRDESGTLARCMSRLQFRVTGSQPSRARIDGSLTPADTCAHAALQLGAGLCRALQNPHQSWQQERQ